MIIVPFKVYKGLNTDIITDELIRRREKYYYGVITLWHIDTFEGGTGSRAAWLKEICAGFERKNNGVYIAVEAVSAEKAKKLILSGQRSPDMLSFGSGLEINRELFEKLDITGTSDIAPDARCDEAVPWCMGAYVMIGEGDKSRWGIDGKSITGKKAQKTVYSVGFSSFDGHNSLKGLFENCNHAFNSETGLVEYSSKELFERYNYSFSVNSMLGSQRDLYRLQSLQNKQKAREGTVTYLGYTDLFQYVGMLKCDNEKKLKTMNDFVDYILEPKQQNRLSSVGMLPVTKKAEPDYDNAYMTALWQEILDKGIKTQTFVFNCAQATQEKEQMLTVLQKNR